MEEERNESKSPTSKSRSKLYVGILTVLTAAGIGGYTYYNIEEPPPTPKTKVIEKPVPSQEIGFIDLNIINDNLVDGEKLHELRSLETRLRLELNDAMKPVLMTPPKIDTKPFDDSIWQKNAQTIISEVAEIEKRKKQAAEEYRKATEAEYLKKRDEANNKFLNEMLNIKLKLQNADNMRLTAEQIEAFENRLDEIQIERNELQRQLIEQWTQEIAEHAEEAVKGEAEKLRAQAQESMTKVREETERAQEAVQERNKSIMKQAMQESAARQDRRRQLMAELQEVSADRKQLEDKMLDSVSDIATKLAVIHKLKLILVNKKLDKFNMFGEYNTSSFENDIQSENIIFASSKTVDLTDELIKELNQQYK